MGITGARYIKGEEKIDYHYAKDGQGNIVAILKDGNIITEYYYDAWGNTLEEVTNQYDSFAKINPFRWRCNYYDVETNMYYINGRYYDPELFSYIDSLDVENVVSASSTIGGLNPYAICTDNPTDLGDSDFNILTNTDFMPDPVYDPLVGYSWWERNWKVVLRYGLFALTFITSVVLICIPPTSAFGEAMFIAGLYSGLCGMVLSAAISGIVYAIQGVGFFQGCIDGMIIGFVDGFTSGAILHCISSAVSAIAKKIKTSNATKPKPTPEKYDSHHVMTNKSKRYANRMKSIADEFGLDLNGEWNKVDLPSNIHRGRHPYSYHDFVFDRVTTIKNISANKSEFLNHFKKLANWIKTHPECVRKSFWKL